MVTLPPTSDLTPHERACRLAAYVPLTLIKRLVEDGMPHPAEPSTFAAATLFADISGFTAMSEQLASDGPRGAEELTRVLLITFDAMIDVIHRLGGAVCHFYGDAMLVYFPDGDGMAANRALACARTMQQLMLQRFSRVRVNRPLHKDPNFALTIKIGVGYGRCRELIVGEAASGMEFVIAGPAITQATDAEKQAQAGQVVVTRALLQRMGRHADSDFTLWEDSVATPSVEAIFGIPKNDDAACNRVAMLLTPFVPRALTERLQISGLSELAEHRPVTSLFVSFTLRPDAYAGESEESQLLQRYYRWTTNIVARFGVSNGRINRLLTGDKGNQLHIIFGAPVAPDAPDQAMRCALALQREQPSFIAMQRIGVAAGKVFAGPLGSELRHEYTIVGDVVNISARLAELCEPGQVLTDASTAERVSDAIDVEPLAPLALRGKRVVITPHRVLRDRTTTTQLQAYFGRWKRPFIGRHSQVNRLMDALAAARGGKGSIVTLAGPAGVGKTRLLAHGVDYWLEHGGTAYIGVCQPHTTDTPFGPWRNIWLDFFNLRADMARDERVTAVAQRTRELLPDTGDDIGLWDEVLGLPFEQASALAELSADVRRTRFFRMARRCLQAAASVRPLLLILEGVHWADRASLDLLEDIAKQIDRLPLCVVVTYRPQPEPTLALKADPHCIAIQLEELTPVEARTMLRQLIGTDRLPPAVEQHLGLRDREGRDSAVNPLLLEEALNVMVAMGVLEVNGRVRVNEDLLSQMVIPDNIHGLLLARIDRLPAAGRSLLQVASVIGRQFGVEPLDNITPEFPRTTVLALLSDLSAAEITQLVTADPEWIYLFQHAMTHEVVYESLPYARRQELHAAIADWLLDHFSDNLKPVYPLLAFHYSRANIHEDGLRYALEAANDARAIFANQEAVDLFTLAEKHLQALGMERHWETAVEIYLSRAEALRFLGDFSAAMEDVRHALALSELNHDLAGVARGKNLLVELYYRQSRYDEAAQLSRQIIEELGDQIPSDDLARAHHQLGMTLSRQLDFSPALEHLSRAEQICLETNNKARLVRVLEAIAYIHYVHTDLPKALVAMQRGAELSREFGMNANLVPALNNIALIQSMLGQPRGALESLNSAIALAQDVSLNFLAHVLSNRAAVHAYLGDFDAAQGDFQEALEHFQAMDDEFGMVETLLLWGYEFNNPLQRWEEASRQFGQARTLIDKHPDNYLEQQVRLLVGDGQVALASGDAADAATLFADAAALSSEKEIHWWEAIAAYHRGAAQAQLGDAAGARTWLTRALEQADAGSCPDYVPLAFLALAQLAEQPAEREEYLRRCLEAAEQRARVVDRLHCYETAGGALQASSDSALVSLGDNYVRRAEALRAQIIHPRPDETAELGLGLLQT